MAELFSYERDVAPAGTNFFAEIGANSKLDREAVSRLQGKLLGGLGEIEEQRNKLAEERMQGKLRGLQYREGVSALEDARARRARIESETAKVGEVKGAVDSIIRGGADPDTKRQQLAELEFATSGIDDPSVRRVFDTGREVLPAPRTSQFTPAQIASFAEDVPPEVLARQDPVEIGQYVGMAAQRKKEIEERRKQLEESDDERGKLLEKDFEFDEDESGLRNWMKPESTSDASLVVEVFGTPEEKAQFAKLKTAPDDKDRAMLAMKIQNRERLRRVAPSKRDAVRNRYGL